MIISLIYINIFFLGLYTHILLIHKDKLIKGRLDIIKSKLFYF